MKPWLPRCSLDREPEEPAWMNGPLRDNGAGGLWRRAARFGGGRRDGETAHKRQSAVARSRSEFYSVSTKLGIHVRR